MDSARLTPGRGIKDVLMPASSSGYLICQVRSGKHSRRFVKAVVPDGPATALLNTMSH